MAEKCRNVAKLSNPFRKHIAEMEMAKCGKVRIGGKVKKCCELAKPLKKHIAEMEMSELLNSGSC